MVYGYAGRILYVNLSSSEFYIKDLDVDYVYPVIGGAGLGIKLLYEEVNPNVDPLSPDNRLIFSVGPIVGSGAPCVSRMAVVAKSPLTGAVGMSMAGGYFPTEIKFAGYDAIVIYGRAEKPVYLWIENDKVSIEDASSIWHLTTTDTQLLLKEKLSRPEAKVACIGPAGENLVRYACIINERRAAGRKGLGAVMGSKRLKAIAIRGTGRVGIASREKFRENVKKMHELMAKSPALYPSFSKFGTPITVEVTAELGILPAKNWTATGCFAPVETLGGEAQSNYTITRMGCYGCPVRCGQIKVVDRGPFAGCMTEGPEFETTYSLGTMCGINYFPAVIAADRYCDEYGLDTISTGACIAFAMELVERGILSRGEVDNLDLRFGNYEAVIEMVRRIAYREGFGNILAEGVKRASGIIGRGSERYALHVKGMELPGYDVRGAKAHGLNYATAYTGADHNRGYAIQEIFNVPVPYMVDRLALDGKGRLCKWNQDVRTAVCDCMPLCVFIFDMGLAADALELMANLYESLTGLGMKAEDVYAAGERVNNIARLFNFKAGFTRKDDALPARIMEEAIPGGPSKDQMITFEELNKMLDEYYEARGWDRERGVPTDEKLRQLGIK
ncbi:MAG: aldehyde ferredoxin oxidoreductase family protein [Candidatus Bathyarchaeota archaeon]|nr:aldehyde ferredoxin oxidoreductase family protein [Candidatus Bathyarchaeota archaeon]